MRDFVALVEIEERTAVEAEAETTAVSEPPPLPSDLEAKPEKAVCFGRSAAVGCLCPLKH